MNHELTQRFAAVDSYVSGVCSVGVPEEYLPNLLKFGTVLICGNVEQCIQIIILHRLHARAHPKVLNFVKSHFRRGMNFDCTAISQLLARFDSEWYRKFERFVAQNDDVKEGVSSVYGIRNSVAHGGSSGVGSKRLKELYETSRRLIDGVVDATS